MTAHDESSLEEIVALHRAAFPAFFLTQLGARFLRQYYRCVREHPMGILLTEREGGRCIGFVAGFADPASFYRALRRRRLRLALAALGAIARRPWLLPTLLANYATTGARGSAPPARDAAELSSLAVDPEASRRGVGARLVHRFADAARARGATHIFLTTDAHANEGVNAFYRRLGFTLARRFEARPGRSLNEYSIETGRL